MTTARFVPPRVPLVDPNTGIVTREWYLFLQNLMDPAALDAATQALLAASMPLQPAAGGDGELTLSVPPIQIPDAFDTAPWDAYVPTLAAGSGTFTTASAAGYYKRLGQSVLFNVTVTVAVNGTASGNIVVGLPFPASRRFAVAGQQRPWPSFGLIGFGLGPAIIFTNADSSYPGADGFTLMLTGVYEAA